MLQLTPIQYDDLNARQKENYNFLKLSALLADFGYITMRLSDDWQGADFIAQHIDGETFLKVQLKGRLDFREKYEGKNIYIAFRYREEDTQGLTVDVWYLYPHDELKDRVLAETGIMKGTVSWEHGGYSIGRLSPQLLELLRPYRVGTEYGKLAQPSSPTNSSSSHT